MHVLQYYNSGQYTADLTSGQNGLYAQTVPKVRGHAWDYTTGGHVLTGVGRTAREATIELIIPLPASAAVYDRLVEASTVDMVNQNPGKLMVDGWETACYITKSEVDTVLPEYMTVTLTLILLTGVWRRGTIVNLMPIIPLPAASDHDLDYPYDFDHDYAHPESVQHITSGLPYDVPLGLIFYGPAVRPNVTIGSNAYTLTITLSEGERVEVDPYAHKITKIERNGQRTNCFNCAERGDGLDSGQYIFQPLPPSPQLIQRSNNSKIDLIIWQERQNVPESTDNSDGGGV